MAAERALYHERQQRQLCAVHTCNNILQRPRFTKADFDAICTSLDDSGA